jgi:hypothetical protein
MGSDVLAAAVTVGATRSDATAMIAIIGMIGFEIFLKKALRAFRTYRAGTQSGTCDNVSKFENVESRHETSEGFSYQRITMP